MPLKEKEILKKRWDGICEKNQSIYDNHVFIEREYMQFSMQDIYPPMVRLMLPKSFVNLSDGGGQGKSKADTGCRWRKREMVSVFHGIFLA